MSECKTHQTGDPAKVLVSVSGNSHERKSRGKKINTYAGPGRKGDDNSWPKSSFSEFLREPGTECTEKRLLVGV